MTSFRSNTSPSTIAPRSRAHECVSIRHLSDPSDFFDPILSSAGAKHLQRFNSWRVFLNENTCTRTSIIGYGPNFIPIFWPLSYTKSEDWCWAIIVRAVSPRFPTYVILIHQHHRQTDRQTDTACDCKTALSTYSASFIHSFISGMHYMHYECVAPNVDIILQSG